MLGDSVGIICNEIFLLGVHWDGGEGGWGVLFSVYPKARSELARIMRHEVRADEARVTVRRSCGSVSIRIQENAIWPVSVMFGGGVCC